MKTSTTTEGKLDQAHNIANLIKRELNDYKNNDVMIRNMRNQITDLKQVIRELKETL